MSFASIFFLFFFMPFAILGYYITPKNYKNYFLIFASLLFYGIISYKILLLLICQIAVSYFGAKFLFKTNDFLNRKFYLLALVGINLMPLILFKYYTFFIDNLNFIFGTNLKIIEMTAPFGISFYTFKIISYLIDVFDNYSFTKDGFDKFLLYVLMFPQIGAGPITKYYEMRDEIKSRENNISDMGTGIEKFLIGLAKKVLLANNFAHIHRQVMSMDLRFISPITAWLGMLAFSLQIYFDFSGYSDMAIGLGKMMGFNWKENFDFPYHAKNIQEFWKKWHISLGQWFKDYVYIPLGGNRRGILKFVMNIFIVWFLTGFWHGSSWNFIFWGIYFAILLLLEKFFITDLDLSPKISVPLTFLLVNFGWVLFFTKNLNEFFLYFTSLFRIKFGFLYDNTHWFLLKENIVFFSVGIFLTGPYFKSYLSKLKKSYGEKGKIYLYIFYFIILILSVIEIVSTGFLPFLYFKF